MFSFDKIKNETNRLKDKAFQSFKGEMLLSVDNLIGSSFGQYLNANDLQDFAEVSLSSIISGTNGAWKSNDGNIQGTSEVISTTTSKEQISIPTSSEDNVNKIPPLDLIGTPYKAKSDADVKNEPDIDSQNVGLINQGEIVTVIGKVQGQSWYLVGEDGIAQGFTPSVLLQAADIAAKETTSLHSSDNQKAVGQEVSANKTCRTVKQTIVLENGDEVEEVVTACQGPNGWVMQG